MSLAKKKLQLVLDIPTMVHCVCTHSRKLVMTAITFRGIAKDDKDATALGRMILWWQISGT